MDFVINRNIIEKVVLVMLEFDWLYCIYKIVLIYIKVINDVWSLWVGRIDIVEMFMLFKEICIFKLLIVI